MVVSRGSHREGASRRKAFGGVSPLLSPAAIARATPALAVDEAELGRTVFTDLREGGEILFNSPYYEHLNEVGSVI